MQIGELFVRLSATSAPLDKALRNAQGSLNRFDSSVGRLQKSMVTLQRNWFAFSAATAGIVVGFNRAFAAADAFDASQRRLAATAKITGQSLGFLQDISQDGQEGFRLSATLANDFAIEITKLTAKAGELDKTSEALGAFLNLGAARGLDATKTLQAVQQAILGIDEGTDKLFGANPSVLYKQLADSIGISVQAMTDQQKAQALLAAALRDGGKVAGEYAEFLKSPAGAQALFAQRTEESARRVGSAWAGIRAAALPVMAEFLEVFGKLVEFIPKGALIIARGIAYIPEYALKAIGKTLQGLALLSDAFVAGVALYTRGAVQLGSGLADGLRSQGAELERTGAELGARVGRNFTRLMSEVSADVDLARMGSNIEANVTTPLANAAEAAEKLVKSLKSVKIEGNRLTSVKDALGGAKQRAGFVPNVTGGAPSAPGIIGAVPTGGGGAGGGGILGTLSGFANQAGSQIMGMVAQFGPLAAVAAALKPVLEGLKDVIGPALSALAEPLRAVGETIGSVIKPVLELLAEPLTLVANLFRLLLEPLRGSIAIIVASVTPGLKLLGAVLKVVTTVFSYVIQGVGIFVEGLGRFVDKIVPDWLSKAGKNLAKAGQEMQDNAKRMRNPIDDTTDSVAGLGDAAEKATASLTNYANVAHINALRFMVGGSTVGGGAGAGMGAGGGVTRPGGRPPLHITVNGMPAEVLVEEGGRVVQRVRSRGGATRLALAT